LLGLDALLPLGLGDGLFETAPVLLTLWAPRRWQTLAIAALASVCVLVGLFVSPHGVAFDIALLNRTLAIMTIWATAGVMVLYKRSEEHALAQEREAGQHLARVVEAAPDAMFVTDREGVIRLSNSNASRLFGCSPTELTGRRLPDLLAEPCRPDEQVRRSSLSDPDAPASVPPFESWGLRADGEEIALEVCMSVIRAEEPMLIVSALRDITTRKQLEERLRHVQKMEAVGRLAGGVAHDFNNLLTVIMSYADFIRSSATPGSRTYGDINEVLQTAKRAQQLTGQLLAFSRRQVMKPELVNLNELVRSVHQMLDRVLGEDVSLVTVTDPELWLVRVDPTHVEQVLLNLVVNARDAMPGGGKLTIETANVRLDERYVGEHPKMQLGDFVVVAVTDTGTGMTDEVKARLFEPFFTTKERGRGTGLGLATCYGLVTQAGGRIWVYSEIGRGTTFKIYLPRAHGVAAKPASRAHEPAPRGGDETILLVEDEPAIRQAAERALVQAGYTVLSAETGAAALHKSRANEGPIHLLLTDVVMPEMSGKDLASQLASERPELKVLYMSGYTDNAIVHDGTLDPDVLFLQKPFVPVTLLARVRAALDGAVSGKNGA
jgi:two-component system, cell cycle sensor histidine kinase and response regulator CckA